MTETATAGTTTAPRDRGWSGVRRHRWTVWGLLVLGVFVSACSARVPTSDDPNGAAEQLSRVLSTRVSDEDRLTLAMAENELVRRCMAEEGFSWTPPPVPSGTSPSTSGGVLPYWTMTEEADSGGYGLVELGAQIRENPRDSTEGGGSGISPEFQALSPREQQEFDVAMFGSGQTVTVELPGGLTVEESVGGCIGTARDYLYGNPEDRIRLITFLHNVYPLVASEVLSDRSVRSATTKWRRCMRSHGYEVDDPGALVGDLLDQAVEGTLSAEDESAAARADFSCKQDSGLAVAVGTALEAVASDEGEGIEAMLAAAIQMEREALPKAKQVLGRQLEPVTSP